ncbi:MAG: DNA methyltransferase [Chloroflexota bacterium]|nr:DNA methyltransferase [Chloroflexota bacterium]
MDAVFGRAQFRNEIVWRKYGGHKNTAKRKFTTETDTIFFYTKSDSFAFNGVFRPLSEATIKSEYKHVDENGRRYAIPRGRQFRRGIVKKVYLDEHPGVAIGNLWAERGLTMQGHDDERTGYPTQKPLALLKRIIAASSNPGDTIFDPFAGCATTLIAAQAEGREWVGIDLSPKAVDLVKERVRDLTAVPIRIHDRVDIPMRTDNGAELTVAEQRAHKALLFDIQDQRCNGCNVVFPRPQDFHLDHIVARARGGTSHKENFQLLCGHCNSRKGAMSQEAFMAMIAQEDRSFDWL